MERYRVRASYNNANLSPNPNHFFHSSKPKPTPQLTTSLSRRIVDDSDAEISIFDAERYFNGGGSGDVVDNGTTLKNNNKGSTVNIPNGGGGAVIGSTESLVDVSSTTCSVSSAVSSAVDGGYGRIGYFRTRSFRASSTPTASSEASWNSQTGLLVANAPGSVAVSVRAYPALKESRKGSSTGSSTIGNSFRGRRFFGLHCPCYGKKSVQVEDKFSETRSSIRSSSASRQGFPKLDVDVLSNSSSSSSTHVPKKETMEMMSTNKFKIRATERGLYSLDPDADRIGRVGGFSFPVLSPVPVPVTTKELELEPARESLEVFRPSEELARTLRKSSQHLRMAPVRDDDVASDTSSDLFELESFSAGHSTSVYRRRDSLDELPKFASAAGLQLRRSSEDWVAPSECYDAPSEASVEWSVTTAEPGFDRASVANFSSAASDCGEVRFAQAAGSEGGAVKKRGGGGLLSCRCEKAVSVGPNPVRFAPDQQRGPAMLPSPVPVNRSA